MIVSGLSLIFEMSSQEIILICMTTVIIIMLMIVLIHILIIIIIIWLLIRVWRNIIHLYDELFEISFTNWTNSIDFNPLFDAICMKMMAFK